MPDFTNLMLVITISVLTINGLLMIAPNPNTMSLGVIQNSASLQWLMPAEITQYSNVSGFVGEGQGQITTTGLSSVRSGASTDFFESLPIVGPAWSWVKGVLGFFAQLFFGFAITLASLGVPLAIVFVVSIPLVAIEMFGVFYLIMTVISVIAGQKP